MSTLAELPYNIHHLIPRHADVNVLKAEINIKKLEDIIRNILREYCDVNVLGFNSTENYYWCKIEVNNKCLLYTEIRLFSNDYDSSSIIIISESDITLKIKGIQNCKKHKKMFVNNIKEGIYLYQNSSFSQYYIDKCCA